jgi:chromosome segregation ATPase
MTKEQLQKELKEKVKPGVKPSQLKRSKSADDIPSSPPNTPLKKSQSQLEIPVTQQSSSKDQITQLQEQVKFHAETAQNYLQSLQTSQAKVNELEEKLKKFPPNLLLAEQLKEKQKEVESLRSKLENTNTKLTERTEELDNSLQARHEALKTFNKVQEQLKQVSQELDENVEQASEELLSQDEVIINLRTNQLQARQRIRELEKDLNLSQRLIRLKDYSFYENDN